MKGRRETWKDSLWREKKADISWVREEATQEYKTDFMVTADKKGLEQKTANVFFSQV